MLGLYIGGVNFPPTLAPPKGTYHGWEQLGYPINEIIFDNHNQSIPMNSNKLIDTDFQELINV